MIFGDGRLYDEASLETVELTNGETGYHIDITVICDSGKYLEKRATHMLRIIGEQAKYVARNGVVGQHVTFIGHESNFETSCKHCDNTLTKRRIDPKDIVEFTLHPLDFDNPQRPLDVENYNGKYKFRWLQ